MQPLPACSPHVSTAVAAIFDWVNVEGYRQGDTMCHSVVRLACPLVPVPVPIIFPLMRLMIQGLVYRSTSHQFLRAQLVCLVTATLMPHVLALKL